MRMISTSLRTSKTNYSLEFKRDEWSPFSHPIQLTIPTAPLRLPVRDGLVDWDCPEAISIPDMQRALSHIRATGTFPVSPSPSTSPSTRHRLSSRSNHGCAVPTPIPLDPPLYSRYPPTPTTSLTNPSLPPTQPDVNSKEDQNSVGPCPVPDEKIAAQRARVEAWLQPGQPGHAILGSSTPGPVSASAPAAVEDSTKAGDAKEQAAQPPLRICLLDGFLLYSPAVSAVMDVIDIRLFLLVSREAATRRRAARDGYVTLEGFWKDPPGYVDRIVWPNYAAEHAWLFEGADVQGTPKVDVLERNRIRVQLGRGLDVDMGTTLEWAVDTIMRDLEAFARARGG